MMKRAVVYPRVSSDEQAAKGYSLPSQLEACRQYAAKHGFEVVAEIIDDCSGAIPVAERPGGAEIYELLKSRQIDVVIQYTIDRTARDDREYPIEFLIFLRDVQDAGAELHFVDTGKSEGGILDLFRAWQAAEERRKIRERTMRGSHSKARSGKVVGGGNPPYGYRYIDGQFVIEETEARVARMIYGWYTVGDEDGDGPLVDWAIARRLSEMGILTPYANRNSGRPRVRGPNMWSYMTVRRILTSETYAGTWYYGKRSGKGGNGGSRPRDGQVPVTVPAIMTREEWEAAQERREYNKRMSKRNNTRHRYLLRGRIICQCGLAMHGSHGRYYRCTQHGRRFAGLEQFCDIHVRRDIVDKIAWDYVLGLWSDPARFECDLRAARDAERQAIKPKQERLDLVSNLIADYEAEAQRLVSTLASVAQDGIMAKALQDKIANLERRYAALSQERTELTAIIEANVLTDEDIVVALQFREDVLKGMKNPTFGDKCRVLELLQVHAKFVDDEHVRIVCRIPIEDDKLTYSLFGV